MKFTEEKYQSRASMQPSNHSVAYLCVVLWQQDNHPIALSTVKIMHQKLDYLHNNPVAAGFVENAKDWLYSSAKQYYNGQKGMIDIIQIEPKLITV